MLVAVFLLAVSSGFTVVHQACFMETMSCCGTMDAGGPMHNNVPSRGPSVAQTDMPCCTSRISGGLVNLIALFEKQNYSDHQKFTVVPLHVDFFPTIPCLNSETSYSTESTRTSSPQPVGKYVLFASFLI